MAGGDELLISRILVERDAKAFEQLVQRHQSRVRGWLRHLTANPALADDLAQETFLRAWRKISTFKAQGSIEAWLLTIARNEFLQHKRRSGREEGHLDRLRSDAQSGVAKVAAASGDSYGEGHDAGRFLVILSSDERDVMILVHGIGLSHAEASKVADLPLGTVKSHVRRSLAKIREHFGLEDTQDGRAS